MSRRSRPSIVLHIGQHKTGSKALQSFLAHNRRRLAEAGIVYRVDETADAAVRAYAISHFHLFALVRREALLALGAAAAAARLWQRVGIDCQGFASAHSAFAALAARCESLVEAHTVISAEDSFDMQTAHDLEFSLELVEFAAQKFAALAAECGADLRAVVYLRRQDHLLAAHYIQYIKGSEEHAIDFDTFARQFAPRLDARRILACWTAALGSERLQVRPYESESLYDGIVTDFFEKVLRRPVPDGCTAPPADVESVNRSVNREWVEWIRMLNSRAARGDPVPPRAAVLEAAFRSTSGHPAATPAGVAAWLAPAERRALLAAHAEGNSAIAREFLGRNDGRLFREDPPADDPSWTPYPGLVPERAEVLARAVTEVLAPSYWSGTSPSDMFE